jgi:hypothetical protein
MVVFLADAEVLSFNYRGADALGRWKHIPWSPSSL